MRPSPGILAIACLLALWSRTGLAEDRTQTCSVELAERNALIETHTFPPYPAESVRNNEQGAEYLQVYIGTNGVPFNVVLAKSSGFPRLDEAGRSWIERHWRWKRLPQHCAAIVTAVRVNWNLGAPGTAFVPYQGTRSESEQASSSKPNVTWMEVRIRQEGAPIEVKVTMSSGSVQLDDEAKAYVLKNWRWTPLSYPAVTRVSVKWCLRSENRDTAGLPISAQGQPAAEDVPESCGKLDAGAAGGGPALCNAAGELNIAYRNNVSEGNAATICQVMNAGSSTARPIYPAQPYDADAITRQLLEHP